MISLLFKAIFLYFLFIFIRTLYFGYKATKAFKSKMNEAQFGGQGMGGQAHWGGSSSSHQQGRSSQSSQSSAQDDVIEAEFKVVSKKDE
jgi:hypothetical protein